MFDFHLHLARLPQPATLARTLLKKGLRFNAIACEPWEWEVLQKMDASLFEGSTRNYGIHPMAIENVTEADWERLESLLGNYPEAGLGECGLDKRYGGYAEGGLQEEAFRRQVMLARELHRDLHIHCVGDYNRILKILAECDYPGKPKRGHAASHTVFHRFGGDNSVVLAAQKMNPIFSLHQDSFHEVDTYTQLEKQFRMMQLILTDYDEALAALNDGVSVEKLVGMEVREKIGRFKYTTIDMVEDAFMNVVQDIKEEIKSLKDKED